MNVSIKMKRVCNKFSSHQEAEAQTIRDYKKMTAEERFQIVSILKKRVYGENVPDVKEGTRKS